MKKIVITSVLKPVNEVRIYERFSLSLAKTNKYEINIIGIESKNETAPLPNISLNPLPVIQRNIFQRIFRWFRIYQIWLKLKPDLVIITTPELLPAAMIYKMRSTCKLIFDVQEDYEKNIIYQRIYTFPIKQILVGVYRFILRFSNRFVDQYFLAEKVYETDVVSIHSNRIVLENKTADIGHTASRNNDCLTLLFSGTISHYSGIEEALSFYNILKENRPIQLNIIGYCYHHAIREQLRSLANDDPDIGLTGIDYFVDHKIIVEYIHRSHLGIVCHQLTQVSQHRIPTKLYEYIYYNLPFVTHKNSLWHDLSKQMNAPVMAIDFQHVETEYLLEWCDEVSKKSSNYHNDQAGWLNEEPRFLHSIDTLLNV